MEIIGISGKREAGKSTLAKILEQDHGYKRVSLADPLKEMCKSLYGLTDEDVYGTRKETPTVYRRTDGSPWTPRDILIREGCLKRSIAPNFWCDKLLETMQMLSQDATMQKFVIDDIRFLSEITYFKEYGAKFVRLERDQDAIGKAALDDLSETELDNFKEWDCLLVKECNKDTYDLRRFAKHIATHVVREPKANPF